MDGLSLTVEQVIDHFGFRTIQKARGYLRRVTIERLTPEVIVAQVQGTSVRPYRAMLLFRERQMLSTCSCPVAIRCKHCAATALVAIDRRSDYAPVPRLSTQAWIEELRRGLARIVPNDAPAQAKALHWQLQPREGVRPAQIVAHKGRLDPEGRFVGRLEPWKAFANALRQRASFVSLEDQEAIRRLLLDTPRPEHDALTALNVEGSWAPEALELLVDTGRLYGARNVTVPLRRGEPRSGKLRWRVLPTGEQQAMLAVEGARSWVIGAASAFLYVDEDRGELGRVVTNQQRELLALLLRGPALDAEGVMKVREVLEEAGAEVPLPAEHAFEELPVIEAKLVPQLRLRTIQVELSEDPWMRSGRIAETFDLAEVRFSYGAYTVVPESDDSLVETDNHETVRIGRDVEREHQVLVELRSLGMQRFEPWIAQLLVPSGHAMPAGFEDPRRWDRFMVHDVPRLREAGWEIEVEQGFRFRQAAVSEWHLQLTSGEEGWLDVGLEITVEGQRLDLVALLQSLFAQDPRWLLPGGLALIGDDEIILLGSPGLPRIAVEAPRLKHIVGTLIDLLSRPMHPMRLSRLDAGRVVSIADGDAWDAVGLERVQQLSTVALGEQGPPPVMPPRGLQATLRPYQREGLNWLQFLAAHELGGILADDMGLGKTLQILAHILTEKEAGRLTRPALVVVPTTLLATWEDEAARFAPALTRLTLHGPSRKASFARIGEVDLVLTTYALLWRDVDELAATSYRVLVVDEAQHIKNAATRASRALRRIEADHKLCVTGTPIENHLVELWSQFDLLLPGFLGDYQAFREIWATPIEVYGDAERLAVLAKRVRPFIMRRTKAQVAAELPAKSVMVHSIELDRAQRDLYESIRAAMDKRVREAIKSRGIEQSRIVILDALLKLRQVCCDPRLLGSTTVKQFKSSAKLAALMEMLPELIEDGRRILLFSQFTTMLDLIAAELERAKIDFVTLRGDTRDRRTPVERFQREEVPLFLISLRAGGVGLNLTAADTVIHYDPWWNPAAEDQATDRAHRIGQRKPVFVYKLIAAGSIEERILSLQERKAQLAAGVLDEAQGDTVKFDPEDVELLLSPLARASGS